MLPNIIKVLSSQFAKMPGLGPRSAERLVFYLLKRPKHDIDFLVKNLKDLKENIKVCPNCFNYSLKSPCEICSSLKRDKTLVCVVASPIDLIAIEKVGKFNGNYHILGGVINPTLGIGPNNLKINELLVKVKKQKNIKEIILALDPTTEGEATAIYLAKLLRLSKVKVTRIARGLPMGATLEYADEITLGESFNSRKEY